MVNIFSPQADERVQAELRKTEQYRHRLLKRNRKQKRVRACSEPEPPAKKTKMRPKKKTSFDVELKSTGKKNSGKARFRKEK